MTEHALSGDTRESFTVKQIKSILGKEPVLAIVGDRLYKRDGDHYRLLDDQAYASTKEMTDGG